MGTLQLVHGRTGNEDEETRQEQQPAGRRDAGPSVKIPVLDDFLFSIRMTSAEGEKPYHAAITAQGRVLAERHRSLLRRHLLHWPRDWSKMDAAAARRTILSLAPPKNGVESSRAYVAEKTADWLRRPGELPAPLVLLREDIRDILTEEPNKLETFGFFLEAVYVACLNS